MKFKSLILIFLVVIFKNGYAQPWIPDLGDSNYKNPIIYADYSDPDVVRVGDNFFMTSSSFNCFPGLPILHSKDMVNWKLINHAIDIFPNNVFNTPQHGNGIWAPSIRYHDGEFYIYYGDPDLGIFMVKTKDPYGKWDAPVLVKSAHGNIDSCPLWDDDGRVYMVHAFAHSRAGVKSLIQITELNSEGTRIVDTGTVVFDGHQNHPTIEGPKFYKRNGYYYIFAPAGGVAEGWQTVLRSKNVYGPYEDKIVLAQGNTPVNGPHQGAYIELENGECWFIHFQEVDPYGRIVHLQPVEWKDDWPVMGNDADGDGTGEPVLTFKKPNVGKTYPSIIPQTSDDFNSEKLGLQWQWHANYQSTWFSLNAQKGSLRLYPQPLPNETSNFWQVPNLLMQKFPAPEFTINTRLTLHGNVEEEKSGIVVMGTDYAYLALKHVKDKYFLEHVVCKLADQGGKEKVVASVPLQNNEIELKVTVVKQGACTFEYSVNGKTYKSIGESFQAQQGRWIGAKVGLFAITPASVVSEGYADYEYFNVK